jgi:8-oxo-dGTP diphosphatase
LIGGNIDCSAIEATREHIVEAAWLSRSEFEGKTIFPNMLLIDYGKTKQAASTARATWVCVRWRFTDTVHYL